eukprot:m.35814 g.35814  ORF g.35814 m.35814 type:complete len:258 (-) comp11337_c0_seq2:479-1252(-)
MMARLSLPGHPKVLALLHTCMENDPMQIVSEYAALGNLKGFFKNIREGKYTVSLELLSKVIFHISDGMDYISRVHHIVHCDLAARNCLVFGTPENPIVKVSDFGLSRSENAECNPLLDKLPWKWTDPSIINSKAYSTSTDLWSFGVLTWEVFTLGAVPYGPLDGDELIAQVAGGLRLSKPVLCPAYIFVNVMRACWMRPADRPPFREIRKIVEALLHSLEKGSVDFSEEIPQSSWSDSNLAILFGLSSSASSKAEYV